MADNGVFTLDQLHALGQTGTMDDWKGGRIIPGLPKGYYRLPGLDGAYFYDPNSGQVSEEFAKWAAGNIERDPITGVPTAMLSNADAGDVFRATNGQSPQTLETLGKIIDEHSAGASYQDAQDKVLGIGAYQTSVIGKDGKRMAMPTPGQVPAAPTFTDLSRNATGAFDRLGKELGLSGDALDKEIGLGVGTNAKGRGYGGPAMADFWTKQADALASNYEENMQKTQGLQANRIAAGLDPATGTSDAEKARIWATYNSIQDPAERAAYIKYQDPGNLVDPLRSARADARKEEDAMIANQAPEGIEYHGIKEFGGSADDRGGVKVTIGHQIVKDDATGRETFIGNIPVKAEYMKPEGRGTFDAVMHRLGGGVMGAFVGFATGNVVGAAIGAYAGAGGPMSRGSLKNPGNALNFRQGQAQFMDIKQVGTALLFARLTGSGMYGKGFVNGATGAGYGTPFSYLKSMTGH